MKALRKYLIPLWLLLWISPAVGRAEYLDDLKGEVARILPAGKTHQDKVRQFLKVRKFKVTESPKEKTMMGRLETKRMFAVESVVLVVFEFDEAGLVKDVRYEEKKTRP
ncbi:MAG: hypothetical protein ABIZ81_01500 [Opitutaceae bacterium]